MYLNWSSTFAWVTTDVTIIGDSEFSGFLRMFNSDDLLGWKY